ncbi:MAG: FABP family protein [Cyclobacteriaceae bacterium]
MSGLVFAKRILDPIKWLKGTWIGKGSGGYPTMDSFDYESKITIDFLHDAFDSEPLVRFEEIAWVTEKGQKEFKHWETGFFKPTSNGQIQFYVCHNTGRIEVMFGTFDSLEIRLEKFVIGFNSDSIRNEIDLKTATNSFREFRFENDCLSYVQSVATTEVSNLAPHLQAVFHRSI